MYLWQNAEWPNLTYDHKAIERNLEKAAGKAGHLSGLRSTLKPSEQNDSLLEELTAEAVTSFSIEGVKLNPENVRQSIVASMMERDRVVVASDKGSNPRVSEGVARMMVDSLDSRSAMSVERLSNWHGLIHPNPAHPNQVIGSVRDGPIKVVTQKNFEEVAVHLVAPPAEQVGKELASLVSWLENGRTGHPSTGVPSAPVRAAIGHLRFETIHPFDDGNGRIGRALSDYVLKQSPTFADAPFSISRAILEAKDGYYAALETAQKATATRAGGLDVTGFVSWFTDTMSNGLDLATDRARLLIARNRFFLTHENDLLPRQETALRALFEEGPSQIGREFSAKWYQSAAGVGKATSSRDLATLVERGVILTTGKTGRGSKYMLNLRDVQDDAWRSRDPATRVIENITRTTNNKDIGRRIGEAWSQARQSKEGLVRFRETVAVAVENAPNLFSPLLGADYAATVLGDPALRVELGQAQSAKDHSRRLQMSGPQERQALFTQAVELEETNGYARLTNDAAVRHAPELSNGFWAARTHRARAATSVRLIGAPEGLLLGSAPDTFVALAAGEAQSTQRSLARLEKQLGRIYANPGAAAHAISLLADDEKLHAGEIAKRVQDAPEQFGVIRGGANVKDQEGQGAIRKQVRTHVSTIRSVRAELALVDGELVKVVNEGVPAPSKTLATELAKLGQGKPLGHTGDDYRPGLAAEASKIQNGLTQSLRSLSLKLGDETLIAGAPFSAAKNVQQLAGQATALRAVATAAQNATLGISVT